MIKDLLSGKSILIMLMTAVLPLVIVNSSVTSVILFFILFLASLATKHIDQAYILVFLLFFCIPGQLDDTADTSVFLYYYYIVLFLPILLAFFNLKNASCNKTIAGYVKLYIAFVILSLFWWLVNGSSAELNPLRRMTIMLSMIIIFYSSGIKQDDFFKVFDSISLVVGIYYVVEFFLRWNPYRYMFTYDVSLISQFDVDIVFRPHGLLGNPLVTGFVFIIELCTLVYRYYLSSKLNLFLFSFFSFLCLLTVCKAYVLGLLILIVTMLYMNNRIGKKKSSLKYLFLISLAGLFVISISDVAIGYLFQRMDNVGSSSSIMFRASNFGMIWRIFTDYPLGVGVSQLPILIDTKYATSDWISGFSTVDNVFLTYLGRYGVMSIIPILLLFYYFIHMGRLKRIDKQHYVGILTFTLVSFFIGFTFNWDSYNMEMALLGAFIGTTIKSVESIDYSTAISSNIIKMT